jgi:hypothetical protein
MIKTKHPLYNTWYEMIRRCNNPGRHNYKYYGGRGIRVCERWLNSFDTFVTDMGEKPLHYELDRIDNSKDYSPDNCRWATKSQQQINRRAYGISGYKGVYKLNGKWQAQITVQGKRKHLGTFTTVEAAQAMVASCV